jgi:hypothetical protein
MARALNKGARIGMWVGLIVGGVGGGIGLVVGVVVPILTAPGPMKYMGLVMAVPMALIFLFVFGAVYKKVLKPLMESDKLLDTGVQTPGKLVKIWETGTLINHRPVMGMTVEVCPKFGPPYQVDTKSVIGFLELSRLQPGASLVVRVDPKNKMKVAVEGPA